MSFDPNASFNPYRDYIEHANKDLFISTSTFDSFTSESDLDSNHSFSEQPKLEEKIQIPFVSGKDRVPKWVFRQPSCTHQFVTGHTSHFLPSFRNLPTKHMTFHFSPRLLFVRIKHASSTQEVTNNLHTESPDSSTTSPTSSRTRCGSITSPTRARSNSLNQSLESPPKGPGHHTTQQIEPLPAIAEIPTCTTPVDITIRIAAFQFYNKDRFVLLTIEEQSNWLRIPDKYMPFECLVVDEGQSTVFVWGVGNFESKDGIWNEQLAFLLKEGRKVKVVEY